MNGKGPKNSSEVNGNEINNDKECTFLHWDKHRTFLSWMDLSKQLCNLHVPKVDRGTRNSLLIKVPIRSVVVP